MLYAVIACEQMYGGMHGMVSYFVAEGTEEEVEEMAIDESYAIMEEYSSIMDDLEAAAANEIGWDEDELDEYMEDATSGADDEYTRALDEQMAENLQYEIYPIVKGTNLSIERLDNLFNRNPEDFIREYCNLPEFSNGYR
ncbi:MAG TPA: hypothetical protein DCL29_02870 [Eubacterium sp.]|nr:hypothetical protein [Eubacterium sp.]